MKWSPKKCISTVKDIIIMQRLCGVCACGGRLQETRRPSRSTLLQQLTHTGWSWRGRAGGPTMGGSVRRRQHSMSSSSASAHNTPTAHTPHPQTLHIGTGILTMMRPNMKTQTKRTHVPHNTRSQRHTKQHSLEQASSDQAPYSWPPSRTGDPAVHPSWASDALLTGLEEERSTAPSSASRRCITWRTPLPSPPWDRLRPRFCGPDDCGGDMEELRACSALAASLFPALSWWLSW